MLMGTKDADKSFGLLKTSLIYILYLLVSYFFAQVLIDATLQRQVREPIVDYILNQEHEAAPFLIKDIGSLIT